MSWVGLVVAVGYKKSPGWRWMNRGDGHSRGNKRLPGGARSEFKTGAVPFGLGLVCLLGRLGWDWCLLSWMGWKLCKFCHRGGMSGFPWEDVSFKKVYPLGLIY